VAGVKTGNQGHASETLFPDQADFHALAIRHDAQHGEHATIAKVCRLQGVASFVQDLVQFQSDKFEAWKGGLTLVSR
jgi:hypothetical protein